MAHLSSTQPCTADTSGTLGPAAHGGPTAGPRGTSGRTPREPADNALLGRLGTPGLTALLPSLVEVDLCVGEVLQEPDRPVEQVLFPLSGVVSLLVELEDGVQVEAATVGREGMVGLSAYLGAAPTERAGVLVAGRALALPAEEFDRQVRIIDGPLERVLRRYAAAMFTQLARNAACNRVHNVRERTARWLMSTADRTAEPSFTLTQDFLAQALAVRRASVNEAAQALAEVGCISYARGVVTIRDRQRLGAQACSCYAVLARADRL